MNDEKKENLSEEYEFFRHDIFSDLYIPFALVFSELALKLTAGHPLFENWAFTLVHAMGTGLALAGCVKFLSRKTRKIFRSIILWLTALIFTTECLVRNSFQFYMAFDSIFAGVGGVATGYSENIVNSVVNSVPKILLFFAPAVIYTFFGKKLKFDTEEKGDVRSGIVLSMTGIIVITLLLNIANKYSEEYNYYKENYDFDIVTEKYGLISSFNRSMTEYVLGSPGNAVFVMEDTVLTEPQFTETSETVTEVSDDEITLGASFGVTEAAVTAAVEESTVTQTETSHVTETSAETTAASVSETEPVTEKKEPLHLSSIEGYNALDIDFDAVKSSNSNISALNDYVKSLAPSNKNAYTGIFKGKNLILICAEAFSDVVIDEKMTPTLYRLSHNGFYFSEYYQPTWGGSTSTGEYSFITGLVPTHGVDSMYNIRNNNNYFTMGSQLHREGYTGCAYHNGTYDFYNRDKTHINLGYDNYFAFGNGLEKIIKKYSDDTTMITATIDEYIDKQPFSLYYMTISGHCIYDASNNKVKQNLPTVLEVHGNKYKDKTNYYLCYQLELERALTELVKKLEDAGIADDTVICLTADHYPYGLEVSSTFKNDQDYVTDLYGYKYSTPWEKDHNSLVIWSGCLENELSDYSCEISSPTYSLDILPTLSNLFGTDYDSRLLVGRDVFSDTEAIALWNSYSWATERGKYDARNRKFYPNDGYEYDKEYVNRISGIVKNKINFSGQTVDNDYYRVLFGG